MDDVDKKTPEQALAEMLEVARSSRSDPEAAHGRADELLLAVLRHYGHDELCEAFEAVDRWYA